MTQTGLVVKCVTIEMGSVDVMVRLLGELVTLVLRKASMDHRIVVVECVVVIQITH